MPSLRFSNSTQAKIWHILYTVVMTPTRMAATTEVVDMETGATSGEENDDDDDDDGKSHPAINRYL